MVRFYYLLGIRNKEKFEELLYHYLTNLLKKHHVGYTAYFHKFLEAHFLHYDILFEVGILGYSSFSVDSISSFQGAADPEEEIIEAALDKYQKSILEFDILGDKTVKYVEARVLELELAQRNISFDYLKIKLHAYSRFIIDSGFVDMRGYSEAYFFKYYYLKGLMKLQNGQVSDYDHYFELALQSLQNALEFHGKTGNQYGKQRCNLLLSLVKHQQRKDWGELSRKLTALKLECSKLGFHREETLIEYVIANNGLSMDNLLRIVRYYPIVHQ